MPADRPRFAGAPILLPPGQDRGSTVAGFSDTSEPRKFRVALSRKSEAISRKDEVTVPPGLDSYEFNKGGIRNDSGKPVPIRCRQKPPKIPQKPLHS
jgi:hypothetical protein